MKLTKHYISILFFTLFVFKLNALDTSVLLPSLKPGIYNKEISVSFSIPQNTRLDLELNGIKLRSGLLSFNCDTARGTEKEFTLRASLYSLAPNTAPLEQKIFTWIIDKKSPIEPSLVAEEVQNGYELFFKSTETSQVWYYVYNAFTQSLGKATISLSEKIFVPYNSVICYFAFDSAKNQSKVCSYVIPQKQKPQKDFKILNPVPGNWSNKQTLVIDHDPLSTVYWSLDGSDPIVSGFIYEDPVMLDIEGLASLRVSSTKKNRPNFSETISFSVDSSLLPDFVQASDNTGLLEVGDFYELPIPSGYKSVLDDTFLQVQNKSNYIFSAIRGLRQYFPLTLSDGLSLWRIILASNTQSSFDEEPQSLVFDNQIKPELSIHNWYFVSFDFSEQLFYSLDARTWQEYTKPFFVDRNTLKTIYWYAPSYNYGGLQSELLPAKPSILGVPPSGITSSPCFITLSDDSYTARFNIGTNYKPLVATEQSLSLENGLLCEIPLDTEQKFNIDMLVFYKDKPQGNISTSFIIDRKSPRVFSFGIDSSLTYSRKPLSFTPSGEESIHVSIDPPLYKKEASSYILLGKENETVSYTISLYAQDEAQNRSEVLSQKVTVDLNALYVNADTNNSLQQDGSPSAPFKSLDQALEQIQATGKWRIYVSGNNEINQNHDFLVDVSIKGQNSIIKIEPFVQVTSKNASLSFEDCTLQKVADHLKPENNKILQAQQVRALFELENASLFFKSCNISFVGSSQSLFVKAKNSQISMAQSFVSIASSEYALALDAKNSTIKIEDSDFIAKAQDLCFLSVDTSMLNIKNSRFTASPINSARVINAWNSSLSLDSVSMDRSVTNIVVKDTAVFIDKKSILQENKNLRQSGFKTLLQVEQK